MLEEQRMPAAGSRSYNSDEISHMLDVKRVMDLLWRVAGGVRRRRDRWAAVLADASPRTRIMGCNALFGGGLLTAGLLLALAAFVLLAWSTFFIQFHEVFFPPGTWTFDWSDSLIRLFPTSSGSMPVIVIGALVATPAWQQVCPGSCIGLVGCGRQSRRCN